MAPSITKLPLTADDLASGSKGPRPITDDLASGSQIARTHHCSSSLSRTQSFALRHRALRHDCALRCPPSPIAHPSTKLASLVLLRHQTKGEKEADSATVAPLLRPGCALRRATVAPSYAPPSPSVVPWLRPLSRLRCALHRASVAPLRHGPPQLPLGDKRCATALCHCSGEYLAPPPFPATVAPPILPELLKTSISWVCIIFHCHSIFTLPGS
ncbi:hypothetical protein DEO72_LG7g1119 [Vigna unguiculata]|uniref:Uncharacterized protein n=1 Tax=Vigna unguiculata TaxID=3917 RepID=A0A4D6MGB6_VIGUN|nr:hypothetical protein DEO72_LG7g1119 [Vigna unguiculata]